MVDQIRYLTVLYSYNQALISVCELQRGQKNLKDR